MIIYNNKNIKVLDVTVDDNSYRYRVIKGDHNLTLHYSLAEHVEIPVGSYCIYQGERYTLERPEAFKMKHSRNFEYTVTLESNQAKAKIWKFRNPVDGRLKFSLTAKPIEHLQMFVDNMNRRDTGWEVGECIDGTETLINYNHVYCWDALGMMATEFNTEFEFVGKTVHLRKVEYNKNNPLPLSYGRGNGFKPGVGRSNYGDTPPIEILYVQGGTDNIDPSKYKSSELLLPAGQNIQYDGVYFEGDPNFNSANARTYVVDDLGYSIRRSDKELTSLAEDSLDCTDIYPKRIGKVTSVVVEDADNNFYDIVDNTIPNTLNYEECLIEGETMTIIFQSGMLAGREFEVKYYHNAEKGKAARRFEIVPAEIDGQTMPNATFAPQTTDTYVVFKCRMPDAYVRDDETKTGASWDMFRAAVKYLFDNEEQKFSFTGELDGIWSKKDWINISGKIKLGGYIRFSNEHFQKDGVLVRITGIKDYINKPHSPEIELSNSTVGGSFSTTLKQLESDEVLVEDYHRDAIQFTKRRFRDAKETMEMLEDALLDNFTNSINPIAIQTMQMLVGDESLQFRFVNSKTNPVGVAHSITYDNTTKQLTAAAGIIQHLTIGISSLSSSHAASEYRYWDMPEYTSGRLDNGETKYYLYAKVSKTAQTGSFLLSETAIKLEGVSGYYHLLVGVLNSEYDGERSFVTLYGFSEILPGRITTDKIVSADGTTYFDLANSVIGGRIKFRSTNGTEKDLSEFEDDVNGKIDKQARDYADLKKNAVLKETIIEGGYLKNDLIDTNNLIVKNIFSKDGNFKTTEDGTVYGKDAVFEGGTFNDVLLQGSLRNPFVQETDSVIIGGKQSTHDNVAAISKGGGYITAGVLEWDVKQSGRRMCITNYRWGSQISQGSIEYTAPSGKYFYENGVSKNTLTLSRECVELIGYGTSSQFYGWIVLNRIDLMTSSRYGRFLKCLAMGMVTGTNSGASISYKTFDGSTMGVSRLAEGQYQLSFSGSWFNSGNDCMAMLTGYGFSYVDGTAPIKPTITGKGTTYLTVHTSDDCTRNDGSFMFMIFNMNDWT